MRRFAILTFAVTLLALSTPSVEAGFFQNLWRLEQRKNAWLRRTFLGRDTPIFRR